MRRNGHKYGAVRCEVDGVKFASKKEARRFTELKLLEKAGEIRNLQLQPVFDLTVRGERIARYIADFQYRDCRDGALIVEDVKSPPTRTAVYRLKKKFAEALYGIQVQEV